MGLWPFIRFLEVSNNHTRSKASLLVASCLTDKYWWLWNAFAFDHLGHDESNPRPLSAIRPRCMVKSCHFQKHIYNFALWSSWMVHFISNQWYLQFTTFDPPHRWGRKLYQDLTSGLWPLEHPTGRRNRWLILGRISSKIPSEMEVAPQLLALFTLSTLLTLFTLLALLKH